MLGLVGTLSKKVLQVWGFNSLGKLNRVGFVKCSLTNIHLQITFPILYASTDY